jgi:hypothetical protein
MKTFHRLLMAGTVLSSVVSVQMAEAGIATGAPANDKAVSASLIILAQAVEPEKTKPEAAPPKQPAAPAKTPPVAPAVPSQKPATPPAAARPPERTAPPHITSVANI